MERRLLLLGLLTGQRMHGYQLNEKVEHSLGFYTKLKKSTAYYTLEKLEKEGYVRHDVEREGNRPERRVYEITEEGRSQFFKLLRSNLSEFSRAYHADDIAVGFMNHLLAPEAHELLVGKREKTLSALEQLRGIPNHGHGFNNVIRRSIAHLEAEVAWLDSVLDELAGKSESPAEPE